MRRVVSELNGFFWKRKVDWSLIVVEILEYQVLRLLCVCVCEAWSEKLMCLQCVK